MLEEKIWRFCQVFLFVLPVVHLYRLNVPRVLLPYHPDIQVNFELIVTDPEGGCFKWRSTRSDIVSVKMLNVKKDCSDRAMIYATSKHENEQTAMIFAEDKGIVLSCGVAVDIIKKIIISTTTKVLFLDAGPSDMVIQAKNSEGDMFSNLGGIPFEWELQSTSSKRPLRVVPFAQSKYEAPDGIRYLEENKKRGYVVLVEGMQTGTAILKAKLSEPFFKDVASHEITLLVVANLLLVPSSDLYLPVGAVVHYSAQIVKQGTTEPISLPSNQYQLEVVDSNVCSLNDDMSSVVTIALGNTEISLIDKNVKSNVALKPPSVHIYVVEPSAISFTISGDSWYLEVGRQYTIAVHAYDMRDNQLYITDNIVFNTQISSAYFDVLSSSKNGTHFEVKATKSGMAKLHSQLISIELLNGGENKFASGLSCEQLVTISDPLSIDPEVVVLPYIGEKVHHSAHLKASGGTGVYTWSTANSTIVHIDGSGVVTSGDIGETEVFANDVRNILHSATALVKVLSPVKLSFAESPFEALVGSVLKLAISMYVEHNSKLLPVAVCDHVKFSITLSDNNVFEFLSDKLQSVGEESPAEACALLVLKAISSGDITVNVTFQGVSTIAYISSFNKLQLMQAEEVLLTPGSKIAVEYVGGPRPWILDRSKYFAKFEYSDSTKLVEHTYSNNQMLISCLENVGDLMVHVHVGNERTPTNPLPLIDTAQLRVCCAAPSRMEIGIESSNKKNTEKCPKNSAVLFTKQKSTLFLKAYGICTSGPTMGIERPFDSISGLQINWSLDQKKLLKVEGFKEEAVVEKLFATAIPYGLSGRCSIKADADSFVVKGKKKRIEQRLSTFFDISLMGRAKIDADEIVLWNEKDNIRVVRIIGGSGHFDILHTFDSTVIDVRLKGSNVEIVPLRTGRTTVSFLDLCFGNQFEGVVTVTDLDHVSIKTLKTVEIHNEFPLNVRVEGSEGIVFTLDDVAAIDVKIDISPDVLSVVRVDPLNYRLTGKSVGTITVKASARSAAGKIIYSLPHEIQIFAPISILPKLVTLIPESVFQFEIIGGPQPKAVVNFSLNDTSIALVSANGLITSKKLGFTSVSASLNMNNGFSKDSAVIRVVSLAGIKIVVSSRTLDKGGKAWVRVQGIGSDENPFAFCGALYPLHVVWSLGSHGVVEILSPLGVSVSESPENYFQVYLLAVGPGQTEIRVSVVGSKAPSFSSAEMVFEDSITVDVNEPLGLTRPNLIPSSVIISPGSKMELKPNRANGTVIFNVPSVFKDILGFESNDSSVLHGIDVGEAILEMRDSSALLNRTAFVGISVVNPHSLFLELRDVIPLAQDGRILRALPLGFRITIFAGSRDHYGRLIQASSLRIRCRPHRFDLTEITKTTKDTIEMALKRPGETTVMVWDEGNTKMNAFLRIPVASVITPASTGILLYDVTCFKSLIPDPKWTEISSRKHFRFIDVNSGIAVADRIGSAIIGAAFPDNQTTFAEVSVLQPESVSFGEVPQFVTNVGQQQYVFPVLLKSATGSTNVHGCDPSDVKKLDGLKAPFDCALHFKKESSISAQKLFLARAAYSATTNSYACLVEKLPIEYNGGLVRDVEGELVIKVALNVLGKDYKAETRTHFYPCFEIEETELRLDNINSESLLTIRATDSTASYIVVDASGGDVLQISKKSTNVGQTLLYSVQLNVYSSSLWQDYLKECNLTVRNTLTGQIEEVSVKIAIHNDGATTLRYGSEGLIGQLYRKMTLYLTAMGTIAVTVLTLLGFFAWYKGYCFFSSLFAPVYKPQPGVNGVFASDRSSNGLGYMSHVRYMKQPPVLLDRDRYSPSATTTSDLRFNSSPLFSSLNRSAGSSGDSFLWSRDVQRSPALRDKSL